MRVVIETGNCRSGECGDWWLDQDGTLQIRTTKMGDESESAVAIHEWIEYLRCRQDGVTEKSVDDFDAKCHQEVKDGKRDAQDEFGNDEKAPYKVQHKDATLVERIVCAVLKLPWNQHEKNVERST